MVAYSPFILLCWNPCPARLPQPPVYMTFFLRDGWQVQFCDQDLETPLPRRFAFKDPHKIRELARRGEARSSGRVALAE
jgi:hypothetical protein